MEYGDDCGGEEVWKSKQREYDGDYGGRGCDDQNTWIVVVFVVVREMCKSK